MTKVIKGGRTLRFAVTVVVGNGNGEFLIHMDQGCKKMTEE